MILNSTPAVEPKISTTSEHVSRTASPMTTHSGAPHVVFSSTLIKQSAGTPAVLRWKKASSKWVEWHELGRRLAVAAVGPVTNTTALGLHSNNLLWNIERRNWATFRMLLAASREKHLASMQRCHRRRRRPAAGRATHFAGHAKIQRPLADSFQGWPSDPNFSSQSAGAVERYKLVKTEFWNCTQSRDIRDKPYIKNPLFSS